MADHALTPADQIAALEKVLHGQRNDLALLRVDMENEMRRYQERIAAAQSAIDQTRGKIATWEYIAANPGAVS